MASIRDRSTFAALRRGGVRRRSGPVTVVVLADPQASTARVGYAINRSLGNAVTRNRLRRRLRAIVRATPLRPGAYLVSTTAAASALSHDELAAHVRRAAGA